jgi:hypothetical protein
MLAVWTGLSTYLVQCSPSQCGRISNCISGGLGAKGLTSISTALLSLCLLEGFHVPVDTTW